MNTALARICTSALVLVFCDIAHAQLGQPNFDLVPGVVIDHSPASSGRYVGSPSIVILPDGAYLASHDWFGPKTTEHTSADTAIFRSTDRGHSWTHLTDIHGAFWSNLFVHKEAVYLMGTTAHHGKFVIRRSTDRGRSWTHPIDKESGLLLDGEYHCAPVPVVVHKGRIWRAFEDAGGGTKWGIRYRPMMVSAPVDADLLKADSWTASNFVTRDPAWLNGSFNAWLEGNAVVAPDGKIVDVLRVDTKSQKEWAAIINISDDGKTATFDATTGFVQFPGGAKKFTIRYDEQTRRYWSLSNYLPGGRPERGDTRNPASIRNTLALITSTDLREWNLDTTVLWDPDIDRRSQHNRPAFQYADWQFDGDDLIYVSRTAFDDGIGGADSAHNANFFTFDYVNDFRKHLR